MTKKILLIGLGLVVVAAIGWKISSSRAPKVEYDTYDVVRQTLRQTVEVTGEVVSAADIDLKFETSGRVRSIAKKVGDNVKAGDILAIVDDRNEIVGVQRAQAALLSAQASLDRLSHGVTAEELKVAEVTVENANIALGQARSSLADSQASTEASLNKAYGDLDGQIENLYLKATAAMQALRTDVFDTPSTLRSDISSPDSNIQNQALTAYAAAREAIVSMDADITAYRSASTRPDQDRLSGTLIVEAETIRLSAQTANALMQIATPQGGTSQAAFDARKSDVKAAWTDVNATINAAQSQKLLVASTVASNAATLNAAQQAVKVSEGSLASAQASLALKKAAATTFDLSSARASVTQAAASLGEAQLLLDKTRIRAPFPGVIAQIVGRVGATATPADVILKLHGENVFEIEADVPETDVAKLKTGLKAEITLDAYGSSVTFPGELTSIDTAQTVIQDVVYYKTRFRLDSQGREVRTGMTSNITVVAVERADVLVVPQRAIRTNSEKYVRTLENDQEIKKPVVTGLYGDDGLVEIVSGLSGGEKVILAARQDGKILKD